MCHCVLSLFPLPPGPHQRNVVYISLLCRAFSAFCRRRHFTRRITLHTIRNLSHQDSRGYFLLICSSTKLSGLSNGFHFHRRLRVNIKKISLSDEKRKLVSTSSSPSTACQWPCKKNSQQINLKNELLPVFTNRYKLSDVDSTLILGPNICNTDGSSWGQWNCPGIMNEYPRRHRLW